MSKKLMLILLPVAALATFGGAFAAAYLTKPQPEPVEETPVVDAQQQQELGLTPPLQGSPVAAAAAPSPDRAMTDQQLRDLVRAMKERIKDYETKLQGLEAREKRLVSVQDDMQEDIKALNDLRVDVSAAVAELKQQRDNLEQTRIRISDAEKVNLTTVAKTLEGMDADSASSLVINICTSASADPEISTEEVGEGYAVKLLHLMDVKKRSKLLAALVGEQADLAGRLSVKLKRILEIK